MKTIQLLQSAATISLVVGKDKEASGIGNNRNSGLRRILQNNNNDNDAALLPTTPASTFQNATCNLFAGETPCHDELGWIITCAPPGDECPCFFDELRCDGGPGPASDSGIGSSGFGSYCDIVCCDWGTQERCHELSDTTDPEWYNNGGDDDSDAGNNIMYDVYCANIDEGGCPCPEGEEKCGVFEVDGGHSGYCASLCCDSTEYNEAPRQTCYDENYEPSYCALVAEGGCPCPEGQSKCGGTDDWAGYCTEACCEYDEEACYDAVTGNKACNKISEGGCGSSLFDSTSYSYKYWESRVASTILSKGSGGQVSYYASIKNRKEQLQLKLSAVEVEDAASLSLLSENNLRLAKHLEEEEAALFHTIRFGGQIMKKKSLDSKKKTEKAVLVTSIF